MRVLRKRRYIDKRLCQLLTVSILLLAACREDEYVSFVSTQEVSTLMPNADKDYAGLYLLCEGNMGSNKCTLDYLDFGTSSSDAVYALPLYHRNIYGDRNPGQVKELGDVGNDIAIYGSKLWIVVNCSNKVEVCDARSTRHLGQIDIPNGRYLAFDRQYAYVSSYAGPVQIDEHTTLGRVYKVDTLTLQKVDSLTVGYQPEEMAVIGNKLYVANSGGYRVPYYDNRLTVIDLTTFEVSEQVEVGINLHHVAADRYGQLWVTSRGDYYDEPPALYWLKENQVKGKIDVPVSSMYLKGDSLFYIGTDFNNVNGGYTKGFGIVDVRSHQSIDTELFAADEISRMTLPYGLIVNPRRGDFYLMDAKNYVSSGELLHFLPDGTFDWRVNTGDIPSRAVFCPSFESMSDTIIEHETHPYIHAVDEYVPAPGQFINTLPLYELGDDAKTMADKCTEAIAHDAGGLVSLGGWGGYITFHFDHPVVNIRGEMDLYIKGNAVSGGSEAGIVMVSQDSNHNGLPDDPWYELSGSADMDSTNVTYGYELTYQMTDSLADIPWSDNIGGQGCIHRNSFHQQEYFPLWLTSPLTFSGTRLPNNATKDEANSSNWVLNAFRYGYVDNLPNRDETGCSFDISWAVEPISRKPISLSFIDFVRVYTALNQEAGWLGETSTEISGARDLHFSTTKVTSNR